MNKKIKNKYTLFDTAVKTDYEEHELRCKVVLLHNKAKKML